MMRLFLTLAALFLGVSTPAQAERSLTVFAAASLAGVLEEITLDYAQPVTFAYGGSGVMARQIAAGAPADVVVLANPVWMGWLADQGLVDEAKVRVVTGNTLAVIGPIGTPMIADISALPQMLGKGRLAMGHRDAVPAGSYARQWLQQAGLWGDLSERLAETDNVRAALALVTRGQAPLGVVYASDARAEPAVEVIYSVPQGSHDPILYLAAALSPEGADFLAHLTRSKSAETFVAYGFQRVTP